MREKWARSGGRGLMLLAGAPGLEYQHLLQSQLASQRAYYSDLLADMKAQVAAVEARAAAEAARLEQKAKRAERATDLTRALQKELAAEREILHALYSIVVICVRHPSLRPGTRTGLDSRFGCVLGWRRRRSGRRKRTSMGMGIRDR